MRRRRVVRIALFGVGGLVALGVAAAVTIETTMYRPDAPREGHLAITGATVLVGESLEARRGVTVLVRDGRIAALLPTGAALPSGTEVVEAPGATVLPGLIDLHVHLGAPGGEAGQDPGLRAMPGLIADIVRSGATRRRALLEHGVTTVRSVGDDLAWVTDVRAGLRDGELEGPRLVVAGPVLTTAGGHPVATVHGGRVDEGTVRLPATPEEARRVVAELATEPVDVVKVIQERGHAGRPLEPLPTAVLDAVVEAAHARGLPVTAHWGSAQDLTEVLDAGVDGLEHVDSRDLVDGWPDELLERVVSGEVPVTATLAVVEAALPGDVAAGMVARVGELHAAGGRVVLGTDAGMPGVPFGASVHRELELLVSAGLSPVEALRAGTSSAAAVLGVDDIGSIEPGRVADLVVVGGDPTRDIGATRGILLVVRDGRIVLDARTEEHREP